jgi:uncharacterized membrane protein
MRSKSLDLIVAILVVAINVGWALIPNRPPVIGIIFALPLIFVLPGYMLTQMLFRTRSLAPHAATQLIRQPRLNLGHPIGPADHIILALGLSMAIDVVMGFTLNVLSVGLQALSWTLSLGLVTTVFALLAMFMRKKDTSRVKNIPVHRLKMHEYILFGLAILIATLAVWSSTTRPLAKSPTSFTQLWMLPANNKSCGVRIGVQSFESAPVTYRIVVMANSAQVVAWSSVILAPGTDWSQSVSINPGAAHNVYVEALLYRADQPRSVYRNVHLTLHSLVNSKDPKILC